MLFLSDTHCHIESEPYDHDRQSMLERAWQAGLQRILVPGTDLSSSLKAIALAESDDRIFAAVGIHPNNAQTWESNTLSELRELSKHPRVCAIGEIGLDFYRDYTPPELQQMILYEQLNLAAEVDKPIILHCRDAFNELSFKLIDWQKHLPPSAIRIRRYPGVFHSFSGDSQQALAAIQAGFYLGINGSVTFKNAMKTRAMVKDTGPEYLILETDAPYITPVPHRGERNEPAFIVHTNAAIAGLFDQSPDHCAKMTYNNAYNIFNW